MAHGAWRMALRLCALRWLFRFQGCGLIGGVYQGNAAEEAGAGAMTGNPVVIFERRKARRDFPTLWRQGSGGDAVPEIN